jgi:hypothetical protein
MDAVPACPYGAPLVRLPFLSLASGTMPRGGHWMGVAFCTVEARWLLAGTGENFWVGMRVWHAFA